MSNVKDNEYFPIPVLFEIQKKPLYVSGVHTYILRPPKHYKPLVSGAKITILHTMKNHALFIHVKWTRNGPSNHRNFEYICNVTNGCSALPLFGIGEH